MDIKLKTIKKQIAKIVILAGQSNAVGVGYTKYLKNHFSDDVVAEFYNGYEDVLINYYSHDLKSNGFVKTTVNCAEASKDTCGPELGIAKALRESTEENFFIVKCAFGSSNLYNDWLSPSSQSEEGTVYKNNATTGWCYRELVDLLSSSIDILEKDGYEPTIKAFFWMQGESDAFEMSQVEGYARRFENLLTDIKMQFARYISDCVYVDAGISKSWPCYRELNDVKKNMAEQNGYHYIDTIGIGLTTHNEPIENPDKPHYDVDSVIKLGETFAKYICGDIMKNR